MTLSRKVAHSRFRIDLGIFVLCYWLSSNIYGTDRYPLSLDRKLIRDGCPNSSLPCRRLASWGRWSCQGIMSAIIERKYAFHDACTRGVLTRPLSVWVVVDVENKTTRLRALAAWNCRVLHVLLWDNVASISQTRRTVLASSSSKAAHIQCPPIAIVNSREHSHIQE